MLIGSLSFIFIFLPIVLAFYFICSLTGSRGLCNLVLFAASLIFYALLSPKYIALLIVTVAVSFLSAYFAEKEGKIKKPAFVLGVLFNIAILLYFKYYDFGVRSLNGLLGLNLKVKNILLPAGISFFTFQNISYIADVYLGKVRAEKNILNIGLYAVFFPKLTSGPIARWKDMRGDIKYGRSSLEGAAEGLFRFFIGLGKKVIIANNVGIAAAGIFSMDRGLLTPALCWLGAIFYTLEIYFDFSGYTDMALGLGRIFGFTLPENFDYPYISRSITEFWRRWHISLSSWFRDYVYIPLGGNRVSVYKHIRNIFVVWLLTGLWHGADFNFILWGLYFGVILIGEKYVYGRVLEKLPKILRHIYALILICFGWVIFYCSDLSLIWEFGKNMLFMSGKTVIGREAVYYALEYKAELALAVIACLPVSKLLGGFAAKNGVSDVLINKWLKYAFGLGVFALSAVYLVGSSFNPFIYFKF